MPKTEILTRLEKHLNGFTSGVSNLNAEMTLYNKKLDEGPGPWNALLSGGFKARVDKEFQTTSEHLAGMRQATADFQKKVESWANPTVGSKIKNLFKKKKLAQDRENAKLKYAQLTNGLNVVEQLWSSIERFVKRIPK